MQPAPRFITPDGVHPGLTMIGTSTSEHLITGLFQLSVRSGQTFSHPITPPIVSEQSHLCVLFSFGAYLLSPFYWDKVFISGFCVI